MYERVREGVEYLNITDQKEETLTEMTNQRRKDKYFNILCHKFGRLRNLKALHKTNQLREDKRIATNAFDVLRRNGLIERIIRIKASENNALRMELCFLSMVSYAKGKKQLRQLVKVISTSRKAESILRMRSNVARFAIMRIKRARAAAHFKYTTQSKCWKVIKTEWICYGPDALKPVLVRMDQLHRRKLAAKALMCWTGQHDEYKKEKIELTQRIYQWKLRKYLNKPFEHWAQQHRIEHSVMEAKQKELMLLQRAASLQTIAKEFIEKSKYNAKKAKRAQGKLQQFFWKARRESIQTSLELKLKQFYLSSGKNCQRCVKFFTGLRERSKKYLGHADFKLRSTLMIGRAKTFFRFYPSIKEARIKL